MARLRHDPSARGLIYEPLWVWMTSGEPETAESERYQYGGLAFWLQWMFTQHWGPCTYCSHESTPERVIRLIRVALEQGLIGFCDDSEIALDDANTQAVIAVLDEIEPAPTREWWSEHYKQCPTVLSWRQKEEV